MSTMTLTAPMIRPRRSMSPGRTRPTREVVARAAARRVTPRSARATRSRRSEPALRGAIAPRSLPPAPPAVRPARPTAVAAPARQRTRPGVLRLTRRGRLAILLSVLAVAATASLVVGSVGLAGTSSSSLPVRYVVVEGGDTLWSIAGDVAPSADRRDTVAEIVELNALPGSGVRAGQQIAVPAAR